MSRNYEYMYVTGYEMLTNNELWQEIKDHNVFGWNLVEENIYTEEYLYCKELLKEVTHVQPK